MGCVCPAGAKTGLKDAINGKRKLCAWILGGPGSGKGTQCNMLSAHFKLAHLSTGDLLRDVATKDTPLAKEIAVTMQKGGLVDNSTVLKLLAEAMEEAYPNFDGFLIDGYPREVEQGELFCEQIGTPHVIIYLDVADDILTERLLNRRRSDDNEDTIKARLNTFHSMSKPVIDHWKRQVVTVNAALSPDEVNKLCRRAIENISHM